MNSTRPSVRLTELDSLRGLAALSVVFAHYLHVFPVGGEVDRMAHVATRTPLYLAYAGHEAVILFFLLSGFVLALPFLGGTTLTSSSASCRGIPAIIARTRSSVGGTMGSPSVQPRS